jgi:membrane fusion protein
MSLFRKEALEHSRPRLEGDVSLAVPLSWQILGHLFGVTLLVIVVFLSTADYARIETVAGQISPRDGLISVVPPRNGVVSELAVKEGDVVVKGQPLATLSSDDILANGETGSEQIDQVLLGQEESLDAQLRFARAASQAERNRLQSQINGAEHEIRSFEQQAGLQRALVSSAQTDIDRGRELAERGFLSSRDLARREENLLLRRQQLEQLRQSIGRQYSIIAEAQAQLRQVAASEGREANSLANERRGFAKERSRVQAETSFLLRAPVAGQITALQVRAGTAASGSQPLMLIVPKDSELMAELYVPTTAIGSIRVGQTMLLAIDSYPAQQFGLVAATLVSVASAPVRRSTSNQGGMVAYTVLARINPKGSFLVLGRYRLVPGMTLNARIVTEKRSLLDWLFAPIRRLGER